MSLLTALENQTEFQARHIGPGPQDTAHMLAAVGSNSLAELIAKIIPAGIYQQTPLKTGAALSEAQALEKIKQLASQNKLLKSFIGQGYYGTYTPGVILRNILENPSLVHRLHALSARNFARSFRGPTKFSNHGL